MPWSWHFSVKSEFLWEYTAFVCGRAGRKEPVQAQIFVKNEVEEEKKTSQRRFSLFSLSYFSSGNEVAI